MKDYNLQKILNTVKTKIQRGNDLWNSENYADSIKEYKDALVFYNKYNGKPEERRDLMLKIAEGLGKLGNYKKSIQYYKKLLKENPNSPRIIHLLAAQYEGYDEEKALELYLKALEIGDEEASFISASWLMMRNSKFSQQQIKDFNEKCINKFRPHYISQMPPYEHEKGDINKKLKIGYVSSDFYCHAMMTFVLPILENHDYEKYDITLYSLCSKNDSVTDRIKRTGAKFINLADANQMQIAQRIYEDKIDILIDLSGYVNNKVFYLLYKPAPVQMQYLGYLNTYGMKEVDYLIADEFSIPSDIANAYTEKVLYLEHGMQKYCFAKRGTKLPEVKIFPPVLRNGYITFGCFNTIAKIDDASIALWTELLDKIPNAKLLFYRTQLTEKNKAWLIKLLEANNADMSRIEFKSEKREDSHFNIYSQADIALDPLPFSGLTVTIETMLMGVPVLCKPGETLQSKGTARINKMLGLTNFICENDKDFIEKATNLLNLEDFVRYRMTLRQQIQSSELLTNYITIAKDFEALFEKAWTTYCSK